jgi:hypothetical protein
VTALAEIISEVRSALGVGVEVLTDPTMLVQLPNGKDGLPADVGSCTIMASEAQNLPLMPWFPVCSSAFLPPVSRSHSTPC